MPAAMMAMTCQESQSPAEVSRRKSRPSTSPPWLWVTITAEAASVAESPGESRHEGAGAARREQAQDEKKGQEGEQGRHGGRTL